MMLIILITICTIYLTYKFTIRGYKKIVPQKTNAVLITGCDSGIGYSLACHCHDIGVTVFAGCLNLNSVGSFNLQKLDDVFVLELDVTNMNSIRNLSTSVKNILSKNPSLTLTTLVNNAGIMIFGEFAWQTTKHIEQQINVNLVGTMNVTNVFLPHIIKNKGRIINVCSHCSLEALPGLSVYSASKTGLRAWSNALRIELKKFYVHVVTFIPGSFPSETNIFSKQKDYATEMQENMPEDEWNFYKSYFREFQAHLSGLANLKLSKIEDRFLYSLFDEAFLNINPTAHYCYSPTRFWIYHLLFKITPVFIRDQLVLKFVNMPKWKE